MSYLQYTPEEVAQRGKAIYEQEIRAKVETGNEGKYLVIDIETGDYEIGDDYLTPSKLLHAKHEGAALYAMRIGYPAVGRIGGRFVGVKP